MNAAGVVIKIGGGLLASGRLETVCAAVARAGYRWPIVVVPGGGPFADAVRETQHALAFSDGAAHRMALLAMDQYAEVLVERIPGAVWVGDHGKAMAALRRPGVAVLAPSRWIGASGALPQRWDVTSDSVAAFVAGALDATRLVLIKPPGVTLSSPAAVDPDFTTTLPAGLRYDLLGCEDLERLPALLATR